MVGNGGIASLDSCFYKSYSDVRGMWMGVWDGMACYDVER